MSEASANFTALDTAVPVTAHLELLKRSGVTLVLRYLNPLGVSEKQCTEEEAKAIAAAGLSLGLVSEGWGDFAHGGISAAAGERDAEHALAFAPRLGASEGAAIYFAVDLDASEAQVSKLVLPYFVEIARLLRPRYRVGVYGSGLVCSRVLSARLADLAWLACSSGWRESRDFLASGTWALAQKLPKRVGHFDFDPDDVRGDAGAFVPFADRSQPVPPAVDPLEALAAEVGKALARGKASVANVVGAVTHETVSAASTFENQVAALLQGASK